VPGQHPGIRRFHAQRHHEATGILEHAEQGVIGVAHPHGTVEMHSQGPAAERFAEFNDPFSVKGEQIIVNIDMAHPEAGPQIVQVLVNIGGGIVPKTSLEDRPVAVGALIHATPGGDHRRSGDLDVAEEGQAIIVRKALQLLVSGKREGIQVGYRGARGIDHHLGSLVPDQAGDFSRRISAGQFHHGLFAFAEAEEVEGRIGIEKATHQRGAMNAPADRSDFAPGFLDFPGHFCGIGEGRGRGRKADKIRPISQDPVDLYIEIGRNARSEAVVKKNVMPLFQQTGGNGEEPLGRHAIGDIRYIAGTGEPVESPRMDKDNAFFFF